MSLTVDPYEIEIVNREWAAAIKKHGRDKTPLNPDKIDCDKLAILMEEVGEVSHECTYDGVSDTEFRAGMYRELIQVATMALMWANSIRVYNTRHVPE